MSKSIKAATHGPVHTVHGYTVSVRGESGCAVVGTLDMVRSQAECYLSSRPVGVVDVEYYEQCGRCRGAARVCTNRRQMTWEACPVCAGRGELHTEMLESITLT